MNKLLKHDTMSQNFLIIFIKLNKKNLLNIYYFNNKLINYKLIIILNYFYINFYIYIYN